MFDYIIKVRKGNWGDSNMTSLQHYITMSYNELVQAIGEPHFTDDDVNEKVSTEWTLVAECKTDGHPDRCVATIYDWKSGTIARDQPDEPYRWHIGGHDMWCTDVVDHAIKNGVQADV